MARTNNENNNNNNEESESGSSTPPNIELDQAPIVNWKIIATANTPTPRFGKLFFLKFFIYFKTLDFKKLNI